MGGGGNKNLDPNGEREELLFRVVCFVSALAFTDRVYTSLLGWEGGDLLRGDRESSTRVFRALGSPLFLRDEPRTAKWIFFWGGRGWWEERDSRWTLGMLSVTFKPQVCGLDLGTSMGMLRPGYQLPMSLCFRKCLNVAVSRTVDGLA